MLLFSFLTRRGKTALGTSAYEKSQRNEDILGCRSVITGVGRAGWMFLIEPSSALLPVLISSLWHEGGAVAPPVQPRQSHPPHYYFSFSLTLALLCHIDLSVSFEGKIINANSPAVQPTNKTCLIHQADIAIKTSLSPLSRSSLHTLSPLGHYSFYSAPFCVVKLSA